MDPDLPKPAPDKMMIDLSVLGIKMAWMWKEGGEKNKTDILT